MSEAGLRPDPDPDRTHRGSGRSRAHGAPTEPRMCVRHIVPLALSMLLLFTAGGVSAQQLVGDDAARARIELRDLARTAEGVSGVVVNRGPLELRRVRVLVQLVYHWPDEMHPGAESPSDAAVVTVDGPIPPGGAASFRATLGPRPDVAAGPVGQAAEFELRGAVLGWKEVGASPESGPPGPGSS